jgi:hypothetical protein
MPPPPPPPVPLFPPPPGIKLVGKAALQSALDSAVTAITITGRPLPRFGLTIVDRNAATGNDYPSAGFNQNAEHYAASMLKVACLYAAHALRDLVQRFSVARKPKDLDDLFGVLRTELNPQIAVCCPMVAGHARKVLLPQWKDVFTASGKGAGMAVRFTQSYTTSLERMIVPSDNDDAGKCIRGVGYAYLNGLLLKHEFFNASSKKGVWLAGDYSGSEVITIPSDNDGDTKQDTTSAAMARLGTVIMEGKVFPGASHTEMIALLKKSAHGSDSSFFTRPEMGDLRLSGDQVTHGKIGYGPLKSGRMVYSDLNFITDPIGSGGHFITCFTNVDYNPYSINHVLWTFLEAVRVYQSAGPAAAAAPAPAAAPAARVTH